MSNPNANAIFEAAMQLPEADRFDLAERLLATLDESMQPPVDPAILAEIQRRVEALDRGELEVLDGEPILEAMRQGRCP